MKLKKLILLALLLATTGMVFVTAFKKDTVAFMYELILRGANEPHALVIDKFTSPIASVSCAAEWLTATASEETVSGFPVLVVVSSNTTNQLVEAIVKVKSENGELAEVRVRQGVHVLGDAYLGENMESNPVLQIMFTLNMLLATGAGMLVGIELGKKNHQGMAYYFTLAMAACFMSPVTIPWRL